MKIPKEILDFFVIYTGDPLEQIEIEFEKYICKKNIEITNNMANMDDLLRDMFE